MPTLIDRHGACEDGWTVIADDAPLPGTPTPVIVSPARWTGDPETFEALAAGGTRVGIALSPSDDPADIAAALPSIALVTVAFPVFTDGRGYSIARLLRERHHWTGELRAVGDVQRDQLYYLARCGFDSFLLKDGESAVVALTAFRDFSESYQSAVDRGPLFRRRTVAG